MGALGQYLRSAREALGIDLRDAAQQTRIRFDYLKALEEEDFSKLPGEVFVKGFLKNYGKFLRLDESAIMQQYGELKRPQTVPEATRPKVEKKAVTAAEKPRRRSIEPVLWGAGILITLALFLFMTTPARRQKEAPRETESTAATDTAPVPGPQNTAKLYLEVIALESIPLTVRIDTSPVKKLELNAGDTLIWSADEGFVLSYGKAGALKLVLNGRELNVDEPGGAAVNDLEITEAGIVRGKAKPGPLKR